MSESTGSLLCVKNNGKKFHYISLLTITSNQVKKIKISQVKKSRSPLDCLRIGDEKEICKMTDIW